MRHINRINIEIKNNNSDSIAIKYTVSEQSSPPFAKQGERK